MVQRLYQYGQSSNITMKEIYVQAMDALSQDWSVAKIIDGYFREKTEQFEINANFTVDFTEDSEWTYFHCLRKLFAYRKRYNWFPKRLGSFLINHLMNALNQWSKILLADKIDDIFKIPDSNLSLSNIANLYSVNDFEVIHESHLRDYMANFPKSFLGCFQAEQELYIKGISKNEDKDQYVYEDEKIKPTKYMMKSPCYENRHHELCLEYCQWSNKFLQGKMSRANFLKIMQFALPQGNTIIEDDLKEKTLAKKIVGPANVDMKPRYAPYPMVIFCKYFKNDAWIGDDIGLFGKVCKDFVPSPTHVGTCMTSGLDTKNTFRKPDMIQHQEVKKIKGGTYSGVATYILDTGQGKTSQFFKRTKNANPETVQMQIHPNYEMAQIFYDENQDHKTKSIKLEVGHEYDYEVSITGQISYTGFRSLSHEQRKCYLESEVSEGSWFSKYSQKNCMYECHARLALEKCGCIPWDFYHLGEFQECDVFGRTCYINTMENLTHMVESPCHDCPKDCDYFKYSLELKSDEKIFDRDAYGGKYAKIYAGSCYGFKVFCDYILDTNFTLKERYSMEYIGTETNDWLKQYGGMIVVNLRFSNPEAEMTVLEARYTLMDKIASLGGSFGIFTQLTGCTVLAFTHLFLTLIKELFQYFPILKREV